MEFTMKNGFLQKGTSMYSQLVFQLIVFFITVFMLDFGVMKRCFAASMVVYWGIVYCLYRSKRLSKKGLFFRFGIIPIFLLVYNLLGPYVVTRHLPPKPCILQNDNQTSIDNKQ